MNEDIGIGKNNNNNNKASMTDNIYLWPCDGLNHRGTGVNIEGHGSLYFIGNKVNEKSYFK